jgi:hypothetical protein
MSIAALMKGASMSENACETRHVLVGITQFQPSYICIW